MKRLKIYFQIHVKFIAEIRKIDLFEK